MLDYVVTGLFTVEAILKTIVLGFAFNGRGSYIRSPWNVLDFSIVIICLTVIFVERFVGAINLTWLRALRTLRWVPTGAVSLDSF